VKFCFVHCPSVSQVDSPMTSSTHKKPNKKLIGVMYKPQAYFTCPLRAHALYTCCDKAIYRNISTLRFSGVKIIIQSHR